MSEERLTPSEVLIKVLEDFGKQEPRSVVVIWTTGEIISWMQSCFASEGVGLLETAKMLLLKNNFTKAECDRDD